MTVTDPVAAWLMTPGEPDLNEWFAELTRRPEWHASAACRGAGTSTFFPSRGANADSGALAIVPRGRTVCRYGATGRHGRLLVVWPQNA